MSANLCIILSIAIAGILATIVWQKANARPKLQSGIEIERKFLLKNDTWRQHIKQSFKIKQGYLSRGKNSTVRIRVDEEHSYLTIKGPTNGSTRTEFEYEIPHDEAEIMLKMCVESLIYKVRHIVMVGDMKWEIDAFVLDNDGLVVAEIELDSETQQFDMPDWIGKEVTHDPRYYNSNLSLNPYSQWLQKEIS